MNNDIRIAIIGGGNMGASLLGGLVANHCSPEKLWIVDTDKQKLQSLQEQYHVQVTDDASQAVQHADVIILAVKPQILADVARAISTEVQTKKPLIISIAAGINIASIEKWLKGNVAIVRAMPNTPALISCGATALFANSFVTKEQCELAESILRAVSMIVWIDDEKHMDIVTALSGSGPAYFFLLIEIMQRVAEKLGLSAKTAQLLTQQTALGAARMAIESDMDVTELRKRVTSPGGTTEQALRVLEKNNIAEIFEKALIAAKNRSEELAKILEQKGA